ncbi:MAG: hypothetical protein BGN88_07945 [Clostridiales bacterium 43-6]|nr:MAG: hypothetical protein BGN88_07945 [Clostridiales bacterium 43-6]
MKIAILSAAKSIHTIKIVNSLTELGHSVRLYSLPDHKDNDNAIKNEVEVIYLPHSGQKGYLFNASALKRSLKEWRPDILNAHYASGYGTLAAQTGFHPLLLSVWGSDVYDFPFKNDICRYILERNIRKADALASTSNIMAERTQKYNKAKKEIYTTPFGVDTAKFIPAAKLTSDTTVIGFIKGVSEKYGIQYLIKAFATVKKTFNEPLALHIYGDGDQLEDMKQLAHDLNIYHDTVFFGRIPHKDVPAALQTMDLFCVPSTLDSESFGVAAVEAMSCGLPVITSDADGLTEVMADNETGFIVERKNVNAMAEKILLLINNKKMRVTMGEAGRKRVLNHYDWNNNIKQLEKALLETSQII